jgi:hypothetical protein
MLEGRDVTAKPDNGARKMPYARRADAWIFLSVAAASADGPATLPDVIGAADMINHEIPLPEEIVGALNRLMFADLVSVNGSQFSLTPEGRATMAETESARDWIAQWDVLAGRWGKLPDPPVALWEPSDADLNAAVEDYYRRTPPY